MFQNVKYLVSSYKEFTKNIVYTIYEALSCKYSNKSWYIHKTVHNLPSKDKNVAKNIFTAGCDEVNHQILIFQKQNPINISLFD